MKYQININQLVLADTELDLIDAAILDYLIFYCGSVSPKIEKQRKTFDGEKYTWIDYKSLIKDMPILHIKSKGALTPRIKRIEGEGYVTTVLENGTRLFVKVNARVDELFIKMNAPKEEAFTKMNGTVHENEPIHNTSDNNTIDNNTILATDVAETKRFNELIDLFEPINPSHHKFFGNKTERKALQELVDKYGFDKMENLLHMLPDIIQKPYAPRITSPFMLQKKIGELIIFMKQEKGKEVKNDKYRGIDARHIR